MTVYISRKVAIAVLLSVLGTVQAASNESLTFQPACGISARVAVAGPRLTYEVSKAKATNSAALTVETEKAVHITVADYNFDGYKDFAAWHIDDGMGTYSIFRIFVYVPKANDFVEITPQCGDEFINIVLNVKKHTLSNSFFADNRMKSCSKKY